MVSECDGCDIFIRELVYFYERAYFYIEEKQTGACRGDIEDVSVFGIYVHAFVVGVKVLLVGVKGEPASAAVLGYEYTFAVCGSVAVNVIVLGGGKGGGWLATDDDDGQD